MPRLTRLALVPPLLLLSLALASCASDPTRYTIAYDRVRDEHQVWSAPTTYALPGIGAGFANVHYLISGDGRNVATDSPVWVKVTRRGSAWRWLGAGSNLAINSDGKIRKFAGKVITEIDDSNSSSVTCIEQLNFSLTNEEVDSLLAGRPFTLAVGNDAFELAVPHSVTSLRSMLTARGMDAAVATGHASPAPAPGSQTTSATRPFR